MYLLLACDARNERHTITFPVDGMGQERLHIIPVWQQKFLKNCFMYHLPPGLRGKTMCCDLLLYSRKYERKSKNRSINSSWLFSNRIAEKQVNTMQKKFRQNSCTIFFFNKKGQMEKFAAFSYFRNPGSQGTLNHQNCPLLLKVITYGHCPAMPHFFQVLTN